jgi:hypothetical protein
MGNKLDIRHDAKTTYVGEMKNQKFHGTGTLYYIETGDLYKGLFSKGLKHGWGEMHYYSGDKYIGEFYHGEVQGKGKYFNNNGYVYEGIFTVGSLLGQGSIHNINNELVYEGEFLNSLPHGFGISYLDGKVLYVGKWNQNVYHGHGLLIDNDVHKYGLFQDGILFEQINKIPQKLYRYINGANPHDSNINLTKNLGQNFKSVPNFKSKLFTNINPVNPTNPANPANPANPSNPSNSRRILQSIDQHIIENPFNRALLNPIIASFNQSDANHLTGTDPNSVKTIFNPTNTR